MRGTSLLPLLLLLAAEFRQCSCVTTSRNGLVGEYFAFPPNSCGPDGSTKVLDDLTPNLTRTDSQLSFQTNGAFNFKRCWFEVGPVGNKKYGCRGSSVLWSNFAARWSGYLLVRAAGMYEFEMTVSDGARIVIGHGRCPGMTCTTRDEVQSARFGDLPRTYDTDYTYGHQCESCSSGDFRYCFVTSAGCEPFTLWMLEGDGGRNGTGTCGMGKRVIRGTRYLQTGSHPFRADFFQRSGEAVFQLKWKGEDTNDVMMTIPPAAFGFPHSKGLLAEWFSLPGLPQFLAQGSGDVHPGAQLIHRQDDLLADTAAKSPWSDTVAAVGGSVLVRWAGFLKIQSAGDYGFRLRSDDGSRLLLGGRGMHPQQVVVNLDGIKDQPREASGEIAMLPGNTPIRIEYLYSPWAPGPYGDTGPPQAPQIQVLYSGPDTNFQEISIARDFGDYLTVYDQDCSTSNWDLGGGMQHKRDCWGSCFDSAPELIGDYVCDNGGGIMPLAFTCPQFNYDGGDCDLIEFPPVTTPKPSNPCLVSCPPGDWKRRDCQQCDVDKDGHCVQDRMPEPQCVVGPDDPPWKCNFGRCCVARLTGVEYWNTDCVAFGAVENCTGGLEAMLEEIRNTPKSYSNNKERRDPKGELIVDCVGENCNAVPDTYIINPFTGRDTDELLCDVGESKAPGQDCFEGPWLETDPFPLEQCEGDRFVFNFCVNNRTTIGRPFSKCCTMMYTDSRSIPQCLFIGIETGTCWNFLYNWKAVRTGFSAIRNEMVLNECKGDFCNDPRDEEVGCPSMVIERPRQVAHLIPEVVDREALLNAGGDPEPEIGGTLILILIPVTGLLAMVSAAYLFYKLVKEPETSPWHSNKAKVVTDDTFIEPTKDTGVSNVEGMDYGVVKPRPLALKVAMEEEYIVQKPRALRQDPALVVKEALRASHEKKLTTEAAIKCVDVEELQDAVENAGWGCPVNLDPMKSAVKALTAVAEPEQIYRAAMPDVFKPAGSKTNSRRSSRRASKISQRIASKEPNQLALPGLVDEDDDDDYDSDDEDMLALPAPPPDANALAVQAMSEFVAEPASQEVQRAAKPGSVTVVSAVAASHLAGRAQPPPPGTTTSAAGRSPASARFQRQGMSTTGLRVCT